MDEIVQDRGAFINAHDPDKSNLLSNCKYKIFKSLKNHWEKPYKNFLYIS